MKKVKAAFFDRDGTLIEDVNYLKDLKDIEFITKSLDLCIYLQNNGYKLFVITNQSGITRGYFDHDFVIKTHEYINNILNNKNIFFEKFYYCPHVDIDNCDCRKPKTGLLLKASEEFNIDLSKSLMFGDKEKDILAGNLAGCKSFYIQDVLLKDFNDIF